jgi:hypothetical protein
VAKCRERLTVNKQRWYRSPMEMFSLKNINEVEVKERYCVEGSNSFASLENLETEVEINSAWEMIRENITVSAKESLGPYELKKYKP